ncbi:hypothetical protein [Streptomyces sp. NPDC007205]|uniref:hypothetical protein n=1 Tax=Streptomyces sp. NPDC007205 TaxID=3154316 RepID=UPI003401F919
MEQLLRDMELTSLTLAILPSAAEDITSSDELALHEKAFGALSGAAVYEDAASDLVDKALAFWSGG